MTLTMPCLTRGMQVGTVLKALHSTKDCLHQELIIFLMKAIGSRRGDYARLSLDLG